MTSANGTGRGLGWTARQNKERTNRLHMTRRDKMMHYELHTFRISAFKERAKSQCRHVQVLLYPLFSGQIKRSRTFEVEVSLQGQHYWVIWTNNRDKRNVSMFR
ncbi:hypothetical protein ANANG_G00205800 [Anguilla anguilla]|uniref:Uncharacterized protein n=1 Tax=Anguilla anguilla TaxID=7936 RepID=A0A9D3RRH7_ANGAN|nr:hypothetical protein ANANG_G00205800 [Anguilla anguilla]